MNRIQKHIVDNWDTLPKSSFNGEEVVIFDCVTNEDYGWGHHSYMGYGCLKDGTIVSAESSGCSCNGGCGIDSIDYKTNKELDLKFDNYNPEVINFNELDVSFSDY